MHVQCCVMSVRLHTMTTNPIPIHPCTTTYDVLLLLSIPYDTILSHTMSYYPIPIYMSIGSVEQKSACTMLYDVYGYVP